MFCEIKLRLTLCQLWVQFEYRNTNRSSYRVNMGIVTVIHYRSNASHIFERPGFAEESHAY
jgi:hypothetical protein